MSSGKTMAKRMVALALAALLAVIAVFAFTSQSMVASADEVEADSWANLKSMIEGAPNGAERTITLTKDLAYDGSTITVPAGAKVKIVGDKTIYRDSSAQSLDSMFTVKGELTVGDAVKLSGKTASCSSQAPLPDATKEKIPLFSKKDAGYVFSGTDVGKLAILATSDMYAKGWNGGAADAEGVGYINTSDDNKIHIKAIDDVLKNDSATGKRYFDPATMKLNGGTLNETLHVLMVTNVNPNENYSVHLSKAKMETVTHDTLGVITRGVADQSGYLGRTSSDAGAAIGITENGDDIETNTATWSGNTQVFHKFWISGGDNITTKYLTVNENAGNLESDRKFSTYAGGRTNLGRMGGRTYFYLQDGWKEVDTWTIDGKKYYDKTKAQAAWDAVERPGEGSCTPVEDCSLIRTTMFNGSRGGEKGYFVQVDGGTFNLEGTAELRDFITGPNVSYVAPIVAKGANSKVNMTGGKITHNSAGYSADNSKSGDPANKIGKEKEDGWGEIGYLNDWRNTETAGAIILTEGASGVIDGTAEISNNRADTGAIVIQGKPDRDRDKGENRDVENGDATTSTLTINKGKLDNNVGIHHAGALYVFNGAAVDMNDGSITNNFSWNKGGAIWASEESYASMVWAPKDGTPSNLPVGKAAFVMNGGKIDGNMSVHRGGAIEVMSDHVGLVSGEITNNYARVLGGAVYVEGDGKDRMYQLFIQKGCITDNHAVRDQNYDVSAPLYRTLNRGKDCNFSNAFDGDTANDISDRGLGFNNYYGHGGGVWMCPFGGNTTFAVPSSEVTVAGNDADSSRSRFKDGDGEDLLVRPLAPGKTNGINFLDLGPNNVFENEKNGAVINQDNSTGIHMDGPIALTNTATKTCNADGGVMMKGNIASDGGAIASNGTIIFGEEAETAQAFTKIRLEKAWSDEFTAEEKAAKKIKLRLQANVDGKIIDIDGYEATLNGTPDQLVEPDPEAEAIGEDQYVENSIGWEVAPSDNGNWAAEMGMPLTVSTPDGVVSVMTFDVNNTPDDTSDDLDPSKTKDLIEIYKLAKAGDLTPANAKVGDWKLVVQEEVNGKVVEHTVDLGQGKVTKLNALEQETNEFTDQAGRRVGVLTTDPIELEFQSTIGNDKQPEAEKYVNNDVHADLAAFDKEFTYDVMAYVPMDATEFTITDTLVKGLEFADAKGNPTSKAMEAVQAITHKSNNNHKPGKDGTVAQEGTPVTYTADNVAIEGPTLTVTFADDPVTEASELADIQGKWVQVTFNARIKDEYRNIDALKKLSIGENEDKFYSWAANNSSKQGTLPQATADDAQVAKLNALIKDSGDRVVRAIQGPSRLFALTENGEYWATDPMLESPVNDPEIIVDFTGYEWKKAEELNALDNAKSRFAGTATNNVRELDLSAESTDPADYAVNYPVLSETTHEGMLNNATYSVKFGNAGESTHKTNTVTVEPKTTKLMVEKSWNQAGDKTWPEDVTVTYGIFAQTQAEGEPMIEEPVMVDDKGKVVGRTIDGDYPEGAKELIVELNAEKTTATIENLPLLKDTTYIAREIMINDVEVDYDADEDGNILNTGVAAEYIVNTLKKTTKVDEEDIDTFVTTNSTAQVEKYVDGKVHMDLKNFDDEFEFSVMGFVPEGATKVMLTDALVDDLEFVSTDPKSVLSNVVVYKTNNHIGDGKTGTVMQDKQADPDVLRIASQVAKNEREGCAITVVDDRMLTLVLDEGFLNDVRNNELKNSEDKSFWVKMSFKAKIKDGSYEKLLAKIASGDSSDVKDGSLNWKQIEDNGSVLDGDPGHAGIINNASYSVSIGNAGESEYETNTVTVKPETTKVSATKEWQDENGEVAEWPKDVTEIKVKVMNGDTQVDTITLSATAPKASSKELPKLKDVTYTVEEVAIPGYQQVGAVTGSGTVEDPYVFTNKKEGAPEQPEIEKYVNKDVHADLVEFDREFTYDVIAYVPNDATAIVISDELNANLHFVSTEEEIAQSAVAIEPSDHVAVTGSVAAQGDQVQPVEASATIEGQRLTVRVENIGTEEGQLNIGGKSVRITFTAQINDTITSLEGLTVKSVTEDKPVISKLDGQAGHKAGDHSGVVNQAKYTIEIDNEGNSKPEYTDVPSNEVTVIPETVKYEGAKSWTGEFTDANNDKWPDEVQSVTFNLVKVKGAERTTVDTVTLTAAEQSKAFKEQPKLDGVTYEVEEAAIKGYMQDGEAKSQTAEDGTTTVTITNKPDQPEIEKYVNKNVFTFVGLDEVFTYDVLAYVTNDADKVVITDELNDDLQFVSKEADVKVVDLGTTVDHTPNGTVGEEGTAVQGADPKIEGKKLTVTIANKMVEATAPAKGMVNAEEDQFVTPLRGHWVKVTFDAKITDGKTIDDLKFAKVEMNNPVLSDETHEGVPNTASYQIEVGNEGKYEDTSNTVTVKPGEKPEAEKYVNNDVTYDFENFDQVFEYEIMGYVPKDAIRATFTDELNSVLEFANGGNVHVFDMGAENDHATTVANKGTEVTTGFTPTVDAEAKKLTVFFNEAGITPLRGKWVKVTFEAQISEAGRESVLAKLAEKAASTADPKTAANSDDWSNISDNGPVLIEKVHDGVPNKATFTIAATDRGDWFAETNTVTVEPKTTEVTVNKEWIAGGNTVDWPEGASVEVKLQSAKGEAAPADVEGKTATLSAKQPSYTFTNLPKLADVTYTVAEGDITAPGTSANGFAFGDCVKNEDGSFTITNTYVPDEPAIEKYVNTDVHSNLVEFDAPIVYDIMAYVTNDAKSMDITDRLVPALEFATPAGVATQNPAEAVIGIGVVAENNHTVGNAGTVAARDYEVNLLETGEAKVVQLRSDEDGENNLYNTLFIDIPDVTKYRGKWIQVTFVAKYTDAAIETAIDDTKTDDEKKQELSIATVEGNGTVLGGKENHTGTINSAGYGITADNNFTYSLQSNTVTVEAETTNISVEKQWKNLDGSTTWPTNVKEVVINVLNMKTGDAVDTLILTNGTPKATSKTLPKLVGVEYKLDEIFHDGYTPTVSWDDAGENYVIVNTENSVDVSITKKWVGARTDELVSADAFKDYLVLKNGEEDLTAKYANKLTVVDNGNFTYTATWTGLPELPEGASYTVDEKPVNGFTSSKDETGALVNTKVRNEQPEIAKFINKDVHQDITLGDAFIYDIIAKVTNDADAVLITDTLLPELAFADGAASVVVSDLGTDINFNTNGAFTGANADASVSQAGTTLGALDAVVMIDKQTITTTIPDATAYRGHWVRVSFPAKIAEGKTLADVKAAYATISATATEDRATPNVGNAPVVSNKDHTGVPNTASYSIFLKHTVVDENGKPVLDEEGNEKTELNDEPTYGDTSNTVTVKTAEEFDVSISKTDLGGTELEGATITLTDENGNVIDEWTSTTEPHVSTLKPGRYTMKEVVAPEGYNQVTTDMIFEVAEDGTVTLITTEVEGGEITQDGNHINLADAPVKHVIKISKHDIASGDELPGAKIQILDKDGKVVKEWTSTDAPESIQLEAGEYTLEEVAAPTGYEVVTKVTFAVDNEGKVTVITATEQIEGGTVEAVATDHLVLSDRATNFLSVKASTVTKVWKDGGNDKDRKPVEFQLMYSDSPTEGFKPLAGKTVRIEAPDANGVWAATFTDLPEYVNGKKVYYMAVESNLVDFAGLYTPGDEVVTTMGGSGMSASNNPLSNNIAVQLSKKAKGGNTELAGAVMQVLDFTGAPVDEWTTTAEAHTLELPVGLYTLHEVSAPAGYKVAADITFRVNIGGSVEFLQGETWQAADGAVTMYDDLEGEGKVEPKPTPETPDNTGTKTSTTPTTGTRTVTTTKPVASTTTAKTSDDAGMVVVGLGALAALALAGGAFALRRRNVS